MGERIVGVWVDEVTVGETETVTRYWDADWNLLSAPEETGGLFQFLPSTWSAHRAPTPEPTPVVPALLRATQRRWRVPQRPEQGTLPT